MTHRHVVAHKKMLRSLKSWIDYIIDNELTYHDYCYRFHVVFDTWKTERMSQVKGYGKHVYFTKVRANEVWRDMIDMNQQEVNE